MNIVDHFAYRDVRHVGFVKSSTTWCDVDSGKVVDYLSLIVGHYDSGVVHVHLSSVD